MNENRNNLPYYDLLVKVRRLFETEPFIRKYFTEGRCCKHVAKMTYNQVSSKFPNENFVELVTWNMPLGVPHALNYDLGRELFVDVNGSSLNYFNGVHISPKLPPGLEFNQNCGVVSYVEGLSDKRARYDSNFFEPLVKRYITHCKFPEFKSDIKRLTDYFKENYDKL